MSFADDIQDIVEDVFDIDIINDLLTSVTYVHHTADPSYVTSTRTVTSYTIDKPLDMMLSGYETKEVNGKSILNTDIKALFPQNNLDVTPNINGTVTIDSTSHEIVAIGKDVAASMWKFQLRKS